jgi:hypothetical protein
VTDAERLDNVRRLDLSTASPRELCKAIDTLLPLAERCVTAEADAAVVDLRGGDACANGLQRPVRFLRERARLQ